MNLMNVLIDAAKIIRTKTLPHERPGCKPNNRTAGLGGSHARGPAAGREEKSWQGACLRGGVGLESTAGVDR